MCERERERESASDGVIESRASRAPSEIKREGVRVVRLCCLRQLFYVLIVCRQSNYNRNRAQVFFVALVVSALFLICGVR